MNLYDLLNKNVPLEELIRLFPESIHDKISIKDNKDGTYKVTLDIESGGGGGSISSVFGRTGIITANAGDYDASKVTNAFDKTVDNMDSITDGTNFVKTENNLTDVLVNKINNTENFNGVFQKNGETLLSVDNNNAYIGTMAGGTEVILNDNNAKIVYGGVDRVVVTNDYCRLAGTVGETILEVKDTGLRVSRNAGATWEVLQSFGSGQKNVKVHHSNPSANYTSINNALTGLVNSNPDVEYLIDVMNGHIEPSVIFRDDANMSSRIYIRTLGSDKMTFASSVYTSSSATLITLANYNNLSIQLNIDSDINVIANASMSRYTMFSFYGILGGEININFKSTYLNGNPTPVSLKNCQLNTFSITIDAVRLPIYYNQIEESTVNKAYFRLKCLSAASGFVYLTSSICRQLDITDLEGFQQPQITTNLATGTKQLYLNMSSALNCKVYSISNITHDVSLVDASQFTVHGDFPIKVNVTKNTVTKAGIWFSV